MCQIHVSIENDYANHRVIRSRSYCCVTTFLFLLIQRLKQGPGSEM